MHWMRGGVWAVLAREVCYFGVVRSLCGIQRGDFCGSDDGVRREAVVAAGGLERQLVRPQHRRPPRLELVYPTRSAEAATVRSEQFRLSGQRRRLADHWLLAGVGVRGGSRSGRRLGRCRRDDTRNTHFQGQVDV